jgi:serine/threonine-protein kinase HipA
MDRRLLAWNENEAEALAKSAGLLSFNRARRIVRDTRAAALARWPELLKDGPDSVRRTVLARLKLFAPPARS